MTQNHGDSEFSWSCQVINGPSHMSVNDADYNLANKRSTSHTLK